MSEQSWEKIGDALKEVAQDFDFDSSGRIVVHDPRLIQMVRERAGKAGTADRLSDTNTYCAPGLNLYCPRRTE